MEKISHISAASESVDDRSLTLVMSTKFNEKNDSGNKGLQGIYFRCLEIKVRIYMN